MSNKYNNKNLVKIWHLKNILIKTYERGSQIQWFLSSPKIRQWSRPILYGQFCHLCSHILTGIIVSNCLCEFHVGLSSSSKYGTMHNTHKHSSVFVKWHTPSTPGEGEGNRVLKKLLVYRVFQSVWSTGESRIDKHRNATNTRWLLFYTKIVWLVKFQKAAWTPFTLVHHSATPDCWLVKAYPFRGESTEKRIKIKIFVGSFNKKIFYGLNKHV